MDIIVRDVVMVVIIFLIFMMLLGLGCLFIVEFELVVLKFLKGLFFGGV